MLHHELLLVTSWCSSTARTHIHMLVLLIMWSMIVIMLFPISRNNLWTYTVNWVSSPRKVGDDRIRQARYNHKTVAFAETQFMSNQMLETLLHNYASRNYLQPNNLYTT
jgi:hypothetical protein